ncbi:SAM-dependent methyltransferase [Fulvivirga sedimenti]|uniref:SAM-dependent methyltransferase n=1 Tax=Fulvivirga sedimenti TaxID=2879465 RepID=A0A9X1HVY8_9BACT|nr:SAM-dependent methyltransferase [Fulvivirga sedimenti]MCA6078385.1 SAM-dependent methyltransferase [Fulvivirga sedimenti]
MKKGTIYLIPSNVAEGHFEVLSPQVHELAGRLDFFLVENIRTARRFISGLQTGQVIEELTFRKVDKNTSDEEVAVMMKPVLEGRDAGVLSEAGCPGIADPGSKVVTFAHKHGMKVVPVSGPSSIFLALMASGFNGQSFTFHGYLPIEEKSREAAIRKMEKASMADGSTHIFMETPYRNKQLLASVLKVASKSTRLSVTRDVTGDREWIFSGTIQEWTGISVDLHKIPCVFLLQAG